VQDNAEKNLLPWYPEVYRYIADAVDETTWCCPLIESIALKDEGIAKAENELYFAFRENALGCIGRAAGSLPAVLQISRGRRIGAGRERDNHCRRIVHKM
jgi:hypothetical protein